MYLVVFYARDVLLKLAIVTACFVATRSNEILGEDFKFPTCKGFFNIFHPYDPIAYRVEPLVIPSLSTVKPVQVPHHKGRKRMHLGT